MKNGRSLDSNGIVAEMQKQAGSEMRKLMAQTFTDILQQNGNIPEEWKTTTVKFLYKDGNKFDPGNYRPISGIPILNKVFASVRGERIGHDLERQQAVHQAGFRRGFSTEDHLLTITIIGDTCQASSEPFWVAALDYRKAFDLVSARSIWQALTEHGIHENYIEALSRLYTGQTARAKCCRGSGTFQMLRGIKQGDPVSPILFNSVLGNCLR